MRVIPNPPARVESKKTKMSLSLAEYRSIAAYRRSRTSIASKLVEIAKLIVVSKDKEAAPRR